MSQQRTISRAIISILNTSILFAISFVVSIIPAQFATMITAQKFGVECVFGLTKIVYLTQTSSELWTLNSVRTIFITAACVFLIQSIVYVALHRFFRDIKGNLKVFFYWVYLQSVGLFASTVIFGMASNSGFGYFANWMYYSQAQKIALAVFICILLALSGFFSAKPLYRTVYIKSKVRSIQDKLLFLFIKIYAPFIIGSLLISILIYQKFTIEFLGYLLTMIGLIIMLSFKALIYKKSSLSKGERIWKLNYINLVVYIVFCVILSLI